MLNMLRRRREARDCRAGNYRSVFAEFGTLMAFVVADQLVLAPGRPRLEVRA